MLTTLQNVDGSIVCGAGYFACEADSIVCGGGFIVTPCIVFYKITLSNA